MKGVTNKIDEVLDKVKKKVYDKKMAKTPEEMYDNIV